jgi:hypothetical protein
VRRERRQLRLPHAGVERKRVKKEQRAATPDIRSRPLLQIVNAAGYGHGLIVTYSSRNATSGSSRVARRTGMRPVTTATVPSRRMAMANDNGAADRKPTI